MKGCWFEESKENLDKFPDEPKIGGTMPVNTKYDAKCANCSNIIISWVLVFYDENH